METTPARKGGRPRKNDSEKKSYKIEMMLAQADFDLLDRQYLASGYRNRSDMYHDMLFHKTLRQKDGSTLEMLKELQAYTREIKGIGAQYQQVVQAVSASKDGEETPLALQKLVALTTELHEKEREVFQIIIKLREKWLREL